MSDIDWPARVRLTSALDQAAIVAITDRAGRSLAEEAGCDGVVVKPIDLKTLVEGLAAGVARSQETASLTG